MCVRGATRERGSEWAAKFAPLRTHSKRHHPPVRRCRIPLRGPMPRERGSHPTLLGTDACGDRVKVCRSQSALAETARARPAEIWSRVVDGIRRPPHFLELPFVELSFVDRRPVHQVRRWFQVRRRFGRTPGEAFGTLTDIVIGRRPLRGGRSGPPASASRAPTTFRIAARSDAESLPADICEHAACTKSSSRKTARQRAHTSACGTLKDAAPQPRSIASI